MRYSKDNPDNREDVRSHLRMHDGKKKDADGKPEKVIETSPENYRRILLNDNRYKDIKYNLLKDAPVIVSDDGMCRLIKDEDDSWIRTHIQRDYGIFSLTCYNDGFRTFVSQRKYHPVKDLIMSVEWDGKQRVSEFLIKWMQCEDTPYNRECSRLIFAGGINRAFLPGCKFDEVIVLKSPQGGGKSALCSWLALKDEFYNDTKTIKGQKGYECVQGFWIVEIPELLATLANEKAGERDEEYAKAFLSSQSDKYRHPYDKRVQETPRQNIFIGTTNRDEFLTDKTGNRRWYPVSCNITGLKGIEFGHWLFDHQAECKADIIQCWAEMYYAFRMGMDFSKPVAKLELLSEIKAQQASSEIDDYRVGIIDEWLNDPHNYKNKVCIIQVYNEAIYPDGGKRPVYNSYKDGRELGEILTHQFGWSRGDPEWFPLYGKQKAFKRPDAEISALDPLLDDEPL